jgi:aromatic-L-amino-acid/L-tryptophan decarboxylase
MATTKLEDILAFVPLFRELTKRQLKHLASLMDVEDYMADAAIVREGTKGDAFYVVLRGQATVTMNEHFLARLVPGDHFGEIAAMDWGRDFSYARTATVVATEPTELLALPAAALRELMTENPAVDRAIRRVARERIATR